MGESYEFYRLEKVRVEPPRPGEFRIVTAAVMECGLCGRIISGMGGGEAAICTPCGDELGRGKLRGCVQWSEGSGA